MTILRNILLLTALLVSSVAQPMERENEKMIKLQSCDDDAQVIEVSKDAAMHSETLKNMLADWGDGDHVSSTPIPLINVSQTTLQHVVACLNIIHTGISDTLEICLICRDHLNPTNKNSTVCQISCKHNYHSQCLASWLPIEKTCPACRKNVTSQTIITPMQHQKASLEQYLQDNMTTAQGPNDLLSAANYLVIKPLLSAGAKKWTKTYPSTQASNLLPEVNNLCAQKLPFFAEVKSFLVNLIKQRIGKNERMIEAIHFSPDDKILASESHDDAIKLWNLSTSHCTNTIEKSNNWIFSTPTTMSGSRDCNLDTGRCTQSLDWGAMDNGNGPLGSLCFSPDGKLLAYEKYSDIRIWSFDTNTGINILQGHTQSVSKVCFSPDGLFIASGSNDKTIKIWEKGNGSWTCIHTLVGHTDSIQEVSFSHNGQFIASGSNDKTIKIWEKGNGIWTCIHTLDLEDRFITNVCFSFDGSFIASGSYKTIMLWDVAAGKYIATFSEHNSITSVCFNHKGTILAVGLYDGTINLFNLELRKQILEFFDFYITIEQATFLNLVRQAESKGKILYLEEELPDDIEHINLHQIFTKLPEWLCALLFEKNLVKNGKTPSSCCIQ